MRNALTSGWEFTVESLAEGLVGDRREGFISMIHDYKKWILDNNIEKDAADHLSVLRRVLGTIELPFPAETYDVIRMEVLKHTITQSQSPLKLAQGCYPAELQAEILMALAKSIIAKIEVVSRKETLATILAEIKDERERQNNMWGVTFDSKNTINDWVTYITNYTSQAAMGPPEEAYEKLMKGATIAVAALEAYRRNGGFPQRHYD